MPTFLCWDFQSNFPVRRIAKLLYLFVCRAIYPKTASHFSDCALEDSDVAAPSCPALHSRRLGLAHRQTGQRHRRGAARPTTHACWQDCPHALLATSGRAVGLPNGQMGNSEVGHMNIGAGRVVAQDLPRIDVAIEDGTLARASGAARSDRQNARPARARVHLMGLLSPGGVHSHQDHMAALVKVLAAARSAGVRACLSGWPRHAAQKRARLSGKIPQGYRRLRRRAAGHRVGPLLRHGPRQALGPGGESL